MGAQLDSLEFEWFFPTPPKPELAITIPNDKCLNLNQNLYGQIQESIVIGLTSDGKKIGLRKVTETETGFQILKSGTIKDINLIDTIKKRGIKLPARYLVEQKENLWIGTLISPAVSAHLPKKTPPKVRKTGLEAMIKKESDL